MNILKTIGKILLGLVVLFLVAAIFVSGDMNYEKSIHIKALFKQFGSTQTVLLH